jgi:hypothetical protein
MSPDDSRIKARLDEALNSIFCPVFGCWPLHTIEYGFYYDQRTRSHVVEVWPAGTEAPADRKGNGHQRTPRGLLYDPAEFEFSSMVKIVPVERFHFSQRESLFEIGWKENGLNLELRVHIVPKEDD